MSVQCSTSLYTLGVHWKPRSPRQSGDMNKAILYKLFQLCITGVQLKSCITFYVYFNCTEKFLDVGKIKVSWIPNVCLCDFVIQMLCYSKFTFSNHFNSDQGPAGSKACLVSQEYTLSGTPVHHKAPSTHSFATRGNLFLPVH